MGIGLADPAADRRRGLDPDLARSHSSRDRLEPGSPLVGRGRGLEHRPHVDQRSHLPGRAAGDPLQQLFRRPRPREWRARTHRVHATNAGRSLPPARPPRHRAGDVPGRSATGAAADARQTTSSVRREQPEPQELRKRMGQVIPAHSKCIFERAVRCKRATPRHPPTAWGGGPAQPSSPSSSCPACASGCRPR